ncbi:MAG TPA: phenylalanine--tRNA ligase subunit beta [Bryobacteraceae bacterium]|nr:phenylalanine--tRNA ligase subunit beta [Bryobacteraceae bacterium]
MIVSTEWLLDYLTPRCRLADLLAALPRVGLDIEATHALEHELAPVRVGFIRAKKQLAGTSDHYVCDVEVARGDVRQIVCASAHLIETGWGVPVALAGADLPTGESIYEETFHGVVSQGRICPDGELGLIAKGSGLQVFHDESLLGKSITEAMQIDEALVHVKVYPNRPDCLGLIGIARELAAMLDLTLVLPETPAPPNMTKDAVPVEILAPSLCTRYTCQAIRGVRLEKSRPWMASRLMSGGLRPISNVVDITNFTMLEWGQPLHAFDLHRVREKIVVRRFETGESLRLLDGRTVWDSGEHAPLAIADAHAPMALAGIMGGEMSGISETTADVLLEAAHFEPTGIRLSSRRLGVSSDSSYRFERGTDPNETLEGARDRAAALFFSEASAQSAGPVTDAYPTPARRAVFSLPAGRVSSYLGIPVTREQVISSLTKLGCRCSDDLARIEVPTRRVDVNDAVVLIEDVARVIGYEAITPSASAETPTAGSTTALDQARNTARGTLVGSGFLEIRGVPLEPLEGETRFSQLAGVSVTLANPLNADLVRLRRSLVPFLVKTAIYNASRRAVNFRYFEIDKIFSQTDGEPEERWALGILLGGALNDADWSTRRECDFFDLKGVAETVLEAWRTPRLSFSPASLEGYTEGSTAQIVLNGTPVGIVGQVSPELLAAERIYQPVFAAELFIEALVAGSPTAATFAPLPRFPAVFRDLSFLANRDVPYAALERVIRAAAGPDLESLDCIDVFAGKAGTQKPGEDRRSIAVSMVFRASDRTLSSEEVTATIGKIAERLSQEFSAELRSG